MKKLNLPLFGIFVLLISSISFQTISAGEVLLRPNGPIIGDNNQRAPVRIALDIIQNDADIALNFLYSVGESQITIENENGDVVYQESIDTYTTLDAYIDTQNFEGGVYTIKISYGSTDLVGEFEL